MSSDIVSILKDRMANWDRMINEKFPGRGLEHRLSDPDDICIKCEVITDDKGNPVMALHYYVKRQFIDDLISKGRNIIIKDNEVIID